MALSFRRSRLSEVPRSATGVPRIVAMKRRHVKEVVVIEREIFPQPWSPTLYLSELVLADTRRYFVAQYGGAVVGYAGCMVMVGEGHITTIGVAPAWQGKGLGRRLFYELVAGAIDLGAHSIGLEVRVTNTSAQELYRSFGFAPVGIRKNYYAEIGEDGLVMMATDVHLPEYAPLPRRASQVTLSVASPPTPKWPNDRSRPWNRNVVR